MKTIACFFVGHRIEILEREFNWLRWYCPRCGACGSSDY